MLVREGVLAGRIENDQRAVRHHRGEFFVVHGVDAIAASADSYRTELARNVGLDDAVDVLSLLSFRLDRLCLIFHGASNSASGNTTIHPRCHTPSASSENRNAGSASITVRFRGARHMTRITSGSRK